MKNLNKFLMIFLVMFSGHLSAASISWEGAPTDVNINNTFTLDIVGSNFLTNVDGGGLNFSFDSSVLNVLSVSIDEDVWNLGAGIFTGDIDNNAGTVEGISVNAWDDVVGDFTVATVTFQAIGSGSSDLLLAEWGMNPWVSSGSLINPDYIDSSVDVAAPVPIPAAFGLFGMGLIGLLGAARRKRK